MLRNEPLRGGFHLVELESPAIARASNPGQFVLLKRSGADWPYLRRPFSIYSSDGDSSIEIVYKVIGRATAVMADARDGEYDVLGPLGNGFVLRAGRTAVVAVAGGAGLPPIAFYCQKYVGALERVTLIIGAATTAELLLPMGLVAQGVDMRPYTEDGSKGTKGTALDGLAKALRAPLGRTQVIACGPRQMLSGVAGLSSGAGVPCDVSVEEIIACGVGACLSCAVPRAGGGYLHVCSDGPVLDGSLVAWDKWK
jgi:dihydroorotate dehydrogenase electron transfer subunit